MTKGMFRVKPYAHSTYKFVVRGRLDGNWRRSYFKNEEEAKVHARAQNAASKKRRQKGRGKGRFDVEAVGPPAKNLAVAPNRRVAIPSRAGPRKAVVILGMHRSGTSALCGALSLVGVDFGPHLMPANHANVKGYWEHEEIVRCHDDLLSSLGSRWDDDKPLPADWVDREKTREVRSLLLGIVERDFAHSALFGIKDPRLCRLMPLWFPVFQALRVEPHFILTVRHPWEVAESLAKRDGIEHPLSYLLWLGHVVQAEIATRSHARSFVRYEAMINDPVATFVELRKQLGVNLRAPSRVRTSLRNFLDPSMRHHTLNQKEADKLRQPVPQLALDFYEAIQNASPSREIGRKVEPLVVQFIRGRELFYPRIDLVEAELVLRLRHEFGEKAKHVVLLQGELKEKAEVVVHFQHEFEEKAKHVVLLQGELNEKSRQVAHFQHELEEKSQRATEFKAQADERLQHMTQLRRDLEEKAGQVANLQRENDRQSQLLVELEEQAERAADELLDARWEALTLRGTLARSTDLPQTSASRVLEFESRLEAALSERDQLRTMLTSLQNDLEQERLAAQAKQDDLAAQLKAAAKELRSEQKQMDRLREHISRRLILPFGRSQRKLQQLTGSKRVED